MLLESRCTAAMSDLRLSLAIHESLHTRDIIDARVKPEGIDLAVSRVGIEAAVVRFGMNLEFDVAEYSLGAYCAQIARDPPANMIALPVFTSRAFRQSAIYINEATGICSPEDLAGRTIGIPQWSQTAVIYVRGYLGHQVGIPLQSITWIQAGVDEPGRRDPVALDLPDRFRLEARPEATLSDMLAAGQVDAVISARPPRCFVRGATGIRRLFPDYRQAEEDYFKSTGIFPVMHLIVLRRDVYESHRWIARNLFEAFEEAKRRSLSRLAGRQSPYLPSAWAVDDLERTHRLLFPTGEPWPYGVSANRASLEPFLAYCFEQGLTPRRLTCEELFAKEASSAVRV